MKWHPAIAMIWVWLLCILAFFILPFQLETRTLDPTGLFLLLLYLSSFVLGALVGSPIIRGNNRPYHSVLDFRIADRLLLIGATVAIVALAIEFYGGNFLDLDEAYLSRNARANALLQGESSGGSAIFQLAFLFYPAGFAALVREIVFRSQINIVRLGYTGALPVLMAALVMGGRGPILYGIIIVAFAVSARKLVFPPVSNRPGANISLQKIALGATFGLVALVAMNYFVDVFLVRASVAGGAEQMANVAAQSWGVSFDGPGSRWLVATVGQGNAYLIYVFIWYLVQGFVMSNAIFTGYDGPMGYGIYGIDLASALVRRINGDFVTDRFVPLLDINVYGFLPSAFGSLYVDFWYFSFIVVFFWGWLTGFVYRKVKTDPDPRWVYIGPFISMGIVFSLINTPIGFGNGLMIHSWMLAVFFLTKNGRDNAVRPTAMSPTLAR
jgi:hypothetical protein